MEEVLIDKINRIYSKPSLWFDDLNFKLPGESIERLQYRNIIKQNLIKFYKFSVKTAMVLAKKISDHYFLRTEYHDENTLDLLIKDLINKLKNNKVVIK